MKRIALVYGGGHEEHHISKISCDYVKTQLSDFSVVVFELIQGMHFKNNETVFELRNDGVFYSSNENYSVDFIIPCIHGRPGESGELQAYLDLIKIPYLGQTHESSVLCFNKSVTKLLAEQAGIPTTPFITLSSLDLDFVEQFFDKHQKVFIKASNQGSSIGCYLVEKKERLEEYLKKSLSLSSFVTIEKALSPRELEVAAYEYQGEIHFTQPGEVIIAEEDSFYDYESKYESNSKTRISTTTDLPDNIRSKIQNYSRDIFKTLKLRDLARIDFFLDGDDLYLNEVNSFPGMTSISLFPKLIEKDGVLFKDYLAQRINHHLQRDGH